MSKVILIVLPEKTINKQTKIKQAYATQLAAQSVIITEGGMSDIYRKAK